MNKTTAMELVKEIAGAAVLFAVCWGFIILCAVA